METEVESSENQLIKEAYAASLDPSRLVQFETCWEAYVGTQLQNSPEDFRLESTPVNTHISLAIQVLERIPFQNHEVAQEIIDRHYGFGFIIDERGNLVVNNSDAEAFIGAAKNFRGLGLDRDSIDLILNWVKFSANSKTRMVKFFNVQMKHEKLPTCWFLAPIQVQTENIGDVEQHFLVTSVEANLAHDVKGAIGRSFGLTSAETEVAALLSTGHSPKDITVIRNVKISSVRVQVVNIKLKMGAKDIPDVVRIFLSMGLRQRSIEGQVSPENQTPLCPKFQVRKGSMTLRDGRNYHYYEQGDPNGVIILQIHSLISGIEFPKYIGRLLYNSKY